MKPYYFHNAYKSFLVIKLLLLV